MGKRYLIVKIAAIGDVIMALPMVEEIRKLDKDADITWICGRGVLPILEKFPIDHIIPIDDKKLLTGNKLQKISVVFKVWKKIAGRKYDVVALGHAARRYQILTLFTRKDIFRSFSHVMGRIWPVPGRHHTDEYVRLVNPDNKQIITAAKFPKVTLPTDLKKELTSEKMIVALAPGGAKNLLADDLLRRWPIEKYVELAKCLLNKGCKIVITGGKTDAWVNEHFKGLEVTNLVGKTDLIKLIGVFQNVDVIVTHDSGPLHLAGLTNVRIVGLFGPTNPYEKLPNRDNTISVWKSEKIACCPCYDGKYYPHCKKNKCMESISVDDILDFIFESE